MKLVYYAIVRNELFESARVAVKKKESSKSAIEIPEQYMKSGRS